MPGISANLIASMRTLAASALTDIYAVERLTSVPDEAGGAAVTPTIGGTGRCLLIASGGAREGIVAGRVAESVNFSATVPLDADITPGDVLIIGGRRFAVVGIGRGGNYAVTATVALREDT